MKYLVTAQEMKTYDTATMEQIGIPGSVLMERAAICAADEIQKLSCGSAGEIKKVLILAGYGNNGGDGLALARILVDRGYEVEILVCGEMSRASGQWKLQRKILSAYPVRFCNSLQEITYDIYVDALFGVGLSREIGEPFLSLISAVNEKKGGIRVALDLPSGVNADTGKIMGCAFRADLTVTFGFAKRGLFLFPGCEYCGKIVIADVGINERSFFDQVPKMFFLDEEPRTLLPPRERSGNKGTFGKALVIAGSRNMAGAAILCAKACYRMGAGMVKVISCESNRVILQETLPEALFGTFEDLEDSIAWADVIAAGPGLSMGEQAYSALRRVLGNGMKTLILDADALNLIAGRKDLEELVKKSGAAGRTVILTPHVGELARLLKTSIASLKEDLSVSAQSVSNRFRAVIAAKDARTVVCDEQNTACLNIRGTDGLATAGSGDVLCGVILGLSAQGIPGFEAACRGVYLHALAGEAAAEAHGTYGMTAVDLLEQLGKW